MGCGASHEGGFRRGWKRDPMADPRDRAAQRREWEQRQDELCKQLFCTDSEGEDPDDDEVAAARAREEAERCGTFAWAPESTSSPPEKKNLWLHRSTDLRVAVSQTFTGNPQAIYQPHVCPVELVQRDSSR